ncbi:alpha/beta fold hydrolase [Acidiplasma cupricumulans]|uniref:2-hydroxy-6-oxo-6-phenylhexa-2,4-dienoate hydrolase n=1 Tax=Acidiplasma cupricumulans TaxID=312540 RepID=A0A0Q0WEA1_9ARCH|nr:alpha/beta hydrolase [Acidiplasma cupricumulans]KQB33657.1 2-hydroxy-6-oxo-6-phenylhexa-2,4-dienoate hydrolase [Acidiplasma cupricumulans]
MLEDKFIDVDGASIHYIESGSGKPFLMFHGARFNCRTYEETGTIDAVANSGFHAISVDFPGFGKSANLSISLSEFINKFMTALKIKSAIILGASMGGEAVVGFAVNYPDMVDGLVLSGAVGVSQYEEKLNNISGKPMLLMWGKNDAVSPQNNYELLLKYNKEAEFYNVGRQHACYLDDSKEFNQHITDFLKKL